MQADDIMDTRTYIAANALIGLLANPHTNFGAGCHERIAEEAARYAECLMDKLAGGGSGSADGGGV